MAKKRRVAANSKAAAPAEVIDNSFGEGFGFNSGLVLPGMGVGGGQNIVFPAPGTSPTISDAGGLFANMRWYLISNYWQVLSQAYCEIGLVQTIVDLPVDDAFRGGIEIQSKQLEPEQIEQLLARMDREDDIEEAKGAAKWNRLYGGAGIIVLTDQDPEEPLNVKAIKEGTQLDFRAADMWELLGDLQETEGFIDGLSPLAAVKSESFTHYDYHGVKVHKSRVMRLKGLTAPAFIRPRLRGWGLSVVESLVRSINQYLKATDVAFELLDEAKIDIYKIKNLTNTLMTAAGKMAVSQRIYAANREKNYQHALTMDSEDDWDHKQLSFAGIADMMGQIRMQVASDVHIPQAKLFGQSSTGFSSGEDDIENYNAMIESSIRSKIKYDLLRVVELRCQQMFGFIPDDLVLDFKPLRVLSAEQEEKVKDSKFNRLIQAKQATLITDEEFRDAVNQGGLFDIKLEKEALVELEQEKEEAAEAMAAKPEGGGEGKPGATQNTMYTYEQHAFEASGGDGSIDPARLKMLVEINRGDALWERAIQASADAYGRVRWAFVAFMFKQFGGSF